MRKKERLTHLAPAGNDDETGGATLCFLPFHRQAGKLGYSVNKTFLDHGKSVVPFGLTQI